MTSVGASILSCVHYVLILLCVCSVLVSVFMHNVPPQCRHMLLGNFPLPPLSPSLYHAILIIPQSVNNSSCVILFHFIPLSSHVSSPQGKEPWSSLESPDHSVPPPTSSPNSPRCFTWIHIRNEDIFSSREKSILLLLSSFASFLCFLVPWQHSHL